MWNFCSQLLFNRDSTKHHYDPDVCRVLAYISVLEIWSLVQAPPPERLLWEWRSISSVPIFTVPVSKERQNEERSSQQSGQESEGLVGKQCFLNSAALQQFPESPNQCSIPSLIYLTIKKSKLNAKRCCLQAPAQLACSQDERSTSKRIAGAHWCAQTQEHFLPGSPEDYILSALKPKNRCHLCINGVNFKHCNSLGSILQNQVMHVLETVID